MNIWEKMLSALRGDTDNTSESLSESESYQTIEQQLQQAIEALKQSKSGLLELVAGQKLGEEKRTLIQQSIDQYEQAVRQALEKNDRSEAFAIAEQIAEQEAKLQLQEDSIAEYVNAADQLREAIHQVETDIQRIEQELHSIKATEKLQQAQSIISERYTGPLSHLNSTMDSLQQIKEQQALAGDKIAAKAELTAESTTQSLDQRLKEAGAIPLKSNAEKVLERLGASSDNSSKIE